jgi:aldose 1-epimerase
MYSVHVDSNEIVLTGGGNRVVIWPDCGGIVNSWRVEVGDIKLSLIDGHTDQSEFAQQVENKGFRSCKLSPYVCRMAPGGFEFEGQQYDIGKYKLGATSIHGLLYNLPFSLVTQFENERHAMVRLSYHFEGTDAGFPFAYSVVVTYTLDAGFRLLLHTQVTNLSNRNMPISDGWHPYFTFGVPIDDLNLSFAGKALVEFDEALLPTGRLQPVAGFSSPESLRGVVFDNCFLLEHPLTSAACRLSSPAHRLSLGIYPDFSYPYLQIYTPPHRQSIAIENLSAAPNAFNNGMGLRVLAPGRGSSYATAYVLEEIA